MTEPSVDKLESISALVDGQLHTDALAQTLANLACDPVARAQWDTYHLVGDAMRNSQAEVRSHDPEFVQRLRRRLAQNAIENVAFMPEKTVDVVKIQHHAQSANDSSWRIVAGFASVALAVVLAWQGLRPTTDSGSMVASAAHQETAVSPAKNLPGLGAGVDPDANSAILVRKDGSSALSIAATDPQGMIRDPHLDALLAAHRQYGGATALQMPAGFLRNATFVEAGH